MAHGEPPNHNILTGASPGAWYEGPIFRSQGFVQKPPLGVMPRDIHREQRRNDLLRALAEYMQGDYINDSNRATVLEWIDELREMVAEGK